MENLYEVYKYLCDYNTVSAIFRIFLSLFLGGAIGYERGKHGRAAGFRTHIIVCVGSCLTSLVGIFCSVELGYSSDPLRIAAQVVSGLGFLGAGAIILKNKMTITGLTTAAGMWTTAVVGIAAGAGFYIGSVICAVLLFCASTFFTMFEKSRKAMVNVYIEIADARTLNKVLDNIEKMNLDIMDIQIHSAKSKISGSIAIVISFDKINSHTSTKDVIEKISEIDCVLFALEQ